MVARRIYLLLLVLAVIIGFYFYGITSRDFDREFLVYFSIVPFFMFVVGINGILANTLSPSTKSKIIAYPLVLGIVYALLFFIHLFVILPIICPNF